MKETNFMLFKEEYFFSTKSYRMKYIYKKIKQVKLQEYEFEYRGLPNH